MVACETTLSIMSHRAFVAPLFFKCISMKKIMLLALVVIASASFNVALADKKKGAKNKNQQTVETPVVLNSSSDSLSYAAGKSATRGLLPYIQQQYQVDTAHIADFVQGFKDAQAKVGDAKYNAYCAGAIIANMVQQRILPSMKQGFVGTKDSINNDLFVKGFVSSLAKDTSIYTDEAAAKMFEERQKADQEALTQAYKEENEAWLVSDAKKDGMKMTADSLQYKILVAGTGATPKATDEVTVKYEGRLIDGTVFDSSYKRNPQTSTFRCDQVIKGWTEALTMMPVGSKWEICIPQNLGYGERQAGQIKPYSTLIFTVELVSIAPPKAEMPAATMDKSAVKPSTQPAKASVAKPVTKKK